MLKPYVWRCLVTLMIVAFSFKTVPALAEEPPGSRPPFLFTQGGLVEEEDGRGAIAINLFRLNPDGTSSQLTHFSGDEAVGVAQDSVSPHHQQIVFSVSKEFVTDSIYSMNQDGSNLTRLVGEPLKGTGSIWSPDGTRIAFSGGHNSDDGIGTIFSSNLAVMNADGSNQQIIAPESNILMFPLFWLPDGQRLLFEGTDENYFSHIYSIQADGSGLTCVSCPPPGSGNTYGPFWYQLTLSPSGLQAAYVGRDNDLYVADTSTGEQHNLTTTIAERIVQPAWSPDGQRLAFGREDANPGLAIIKADGSNLVSLPVPAGPVYEALWSPDGQKIAFTHLLMAEGEEEREQLYVINADGTGLTRLTRKGSRLRIIENYTWAPDSSHLIFASTLDNNNAKYALFQVKTDGSNLTRITKPSDSVRFGAWLVQ